MIDYDSSKHKYLIRQAWGKHRTLSLSTIMAEFVENGVNWPKNFNDSRQQHVLQLDSDITRVWKEIKNEN